MNPSKTCKHKYANQREKKVTSRKMQMKTSEKKKWHYAKRTPQHEIREGNKAQ